MTMHKASPLFAVDPSTKRTSAIISSGKGSYYVTKGAVHTVMTLGITGRVNKKEVLKTVEEYRADESVDALKERLSSSARVLRDNRW